MHHRRELATLDKGIRAGQGPSATYVLGDFTEYQLSDIEYGDWPNEQRTARACRLLQLHSLPDFSRPCSE